MAIFAQPTPDLNLVPGWDVQGTGAAGNPGPDAPGYGQAGNIGSVTVNAQAGAGTPQPPNTGTGSAASNAESVLTNGSYTVSQANAPSGTNPTAVGATITLTSAAAGSVISGLSLVNTNETSGVSYVVGTNPAVTVAEGGVIPAGAKVTAPSGTVFVTTL